MILKNEINIGTLVVWVAVIGFIKNLYRYKNTAAIISSGSLFVNSSNTYRQTLIMNDHKSMLPVIWLTLIYVR